MRSIRFCSLLPLAFLVFACICCAAAPADYAKPGPRSVEVVTVEVVDAERNQRRIPLKLYVPAGGDRIPAVLFSHGLGGSREGGRAWGEHWASHGYLCIHLQHAGSDEGALREAMRGQGRDTLKSAMSPRAFADRIHDVRFVIDLIEREPARIHRGATRIDPRRIGMSGHSYGARTTLALAGERLPFAAGELVDSRIVAAIAFSPMAAPPPSSWPRRFGDIRRPLLSITGTQDRDIVLGEEPEIRREPYRHMPPGDKYLLVLQSADHAVFNGQAGFRGGLSRTEVAIYDHVKVISVAFWDAYLKGDAAAKQWLAGGAAREALKNAGELEHK